MSQGSSKDRVKQYLPSDEEIDRAMEAAMRQEAASGGMPASGPVFRALRENTLARGRVLAVHQDRVVVDLDYKSEGVIPVEEFGEAVPAVGDEIEAWVMRLEDAHGEVVLSVREAQRQKVWDAVGTGADFAGQVIEAVKGGLVVDIGLRAFMPAREADIRYVEDLETLVGQRMQVRVIEADPGQRRVIVSRRAVLRDEREKKKAELFSRLAEGQSLEGTVTNVTDFGAFVDVGGAEGLIHKGDLAWGRVEKVSDVVSLGDRVKVTVLSFDRSSGKIGLGLKQAGPSPWDHAPNTYAAGNRARGRVVGLLDFGAVVELEPGIQGLVHVSEMSWGRRVHKPGDVVELGEEVEVEVLSIDPGARKLSLSMKKVEENPWTDLSKRYPFATIVRGKVTRLADFGAFVVLEDDDIEGLVHVSEISWTERIGHPEEKLAVGDPVTALVIGTDEDRQRLSLSIRKTEPDPWWDVNERFPAGKTVEGTVARLKDFGAFVEVAKGLEGLVHVSNMAEYRVNRARDVVRPGDRVTVEVLESDEEARRLSLRLIEVL